jgi:hypothetical protein
MIRPSGRWINSGGGLHSAGAPDNGAVVDSGSGGVDGVAGSVGAVDYACSVGADGSTGSVSAGGDSGVMGGESSDRLIIFSPDQCDGCQPHTYPSLLQMQGYVALA